MNQISEINSLLSVYECLMSPLSIIDRVRTGPGKPGKSWNLIIWILGLESHGMLAWKVMEFHVGKCVYSRAAYCSGLSDMYAGKKIDYGNM